MSKKLKLTYVADASNIHTKRWLTYFIEQGHDVRCLSDKSGEIDGAEVYLLPNRDTLHALGKKSHRMAVVQARAEKIKTYLADLKPDILHAHYLTLRGWSAALSGFRPLVVSLWGSDIHMPKDQYRYPFQKLRDSWMNRKTLTNADLITAMSQDSCQKAQSIVKNRVPVEWIPLGIDYRLFHTTPSPERLAKFRSELQINTDQFVVLSPRAMTPLYNIDVIIDAIPEILQKIPNAVFILKDTQTLSGYQSYVDALKARVENLGISHAIRWAGHAPYEDMPLYYHVADTVISIPSTDGQPVTLFEAIAANCPVITGDLPSYHSVVVEKKSGLRLPQITATHLTNAVVEIHNALQQDEYQNTTSIWQPQWDFKNSMEKMNTLYEELVFKTSGFVDGAYVLKAHGDCG